MLLSAGVAEKYLTYQPKPTSKQQAAMAEVSAHLGITQADIELSRLPLAERLRRRAAKQADG
jgi:hypothetical protein